MLRLVEELTDDDRARSVVKDVVADAAEDRASKSSNSPLSDDDHLDLFLSGDGNDDLARFQAAIGPHLNSVGNLEGNHI